MKMILNDTVHGGPKSGHKFMAIILNRCSNLFTGRFLAKFTVKWLLKIQPLLAYVATPPCESLVSENKLLAINYKVV